jgi:hypothetical protein
MAEKKRLNRRSFLTRVAGGAVALGGTVLLVSGSAHAQITDRDSGNTADGGGHGRGTGHTDSDPSDGACNGRGRAVNGITDRDPSDPRGNGRGTGRTDSDPNDRPCGGRGR